MKFKRPDSNQTKFILVHGNSSSNQSFELVSEELALRGMSTEAVELAGHGGAPRATNYHHYQFSNIAKRLSKQLSLLVDKNTVLVGHSLGGNLLLQMPEVLRASGGLCLIGTAPFESLADLGEGFLPCVHGSLFSQAEVSDAEVERLGQASFYLQNPPLTWFQDFRLTDPKFRQYLFQDLAQNPFGGEISTLRSLSYPVAVIQGKQDSFINLEYVRNRLSGFLWKGDVQVLPECGHFPHVEKSVRVSSLLEAYAQR